MDEQKNRVAELLGLSPDQLMPGWEVFLMSQKLTRKEDWLEQFLAEAPELKEAYEKGTAVFVRDQRGNITGHFTPDYYLDLLEKYPVDLGDHWREGNTPKPNIPEGYDPALGREHPHNRRWAINQCKAHEENLRRFSGAADFARAPNTKLDTVQISAGGSAVQVTPGRSLGATQSPGNSGAGWAPSGM